MPQPFNGMSLYTGVGERKYISLDEGRSFLNAVLVLEKPEEQTFCEMIYWTGCRPSEALGMSALQIDISELLVVIRSLKKHGDMKGRHFRPVPLPLAFMDKLERVHRIRKAQARIDRGAGTQLWEFSRTTGWRILNTVMEAARIDGVKACARGLRHTMGVHAALTQVPGSKIQTWLGHESADTTAIYQHAIGLEERAIAERMWNERAG